MNDEEKSFFDTLKNGVIYIEQNVKTLKEWNENQMSKGLYELEKDEYNQLKNFEEMIKDTFLNVSTLLNKLKGYPINLNDLNLKISELKAKLIRYEESSGIKKFGYKAWEYPCSNNEDECFKNGNDFKETENGIETGEEFFTKENKLNDIKEIEKEEIKKIWPTYRDKESQKSRMLRSTFKVTSKEALQTFKNNFQNRQMANADKYLGRTPKINHVEPDSKRYTMIPKNLIDNVKLIPNKKKAVQDNYFLTDMTTSKFSFINTNFQNLTHNSKNFFEEKISPKITKEFQEQFTVEFTPGLTTKRPFGKSRFKMNDKQNLNFEKKEGLVTPDDPIEASTLLSNLLSLKKSKTLTPDTPTTAINPHFHDRILSKIRQNR